MGKYAPLERHLKRCRLTSTDLTFVDIERILGAMLPNSAQRPEWWGNETSPDSRHVQCQSWQSAGYIATLLAGEERVRFTRRQLPAAAST